MASDPVSPSLTRTPSATESTGHLTPAPTWTSEQETRLAYCQDQLKQAQKKWSDRQELWIREVDHLLDLKRAHKKAQKKQTPRAPKPPRTRKSWRPLSRTQSNVTDAAPPTPDDGDEDGEDALTGVARSDSMPLQPTPSFCTPPSPIQPTTGRNPFRTMIRRMSSSGVRGRNAVAEAAGGRGGGNGG